MKILWVNSNFLHPTTKGGQIRTLEMLRCLHRRHEIHYLSLANRHEPEGLERSNEYCTRAYPIYKAVRSKTSPAFLIELIGGLFSDMPVAVGRYCSAEAGRLIKHLLRTEKFDRAVCDFLHSSGHYPDLAHCVLFQHNVETMIWERTAAHAAGLIRQSYMHLQARRMFAYEKKVCRKAAHVVAVSEIDAELMRTKFGIDHVSSIPTGVDIDYFAPPARQTRTGDLVFVGSMDWRPNEDGVLWFVQEILPLIWRSRPDCTFTIVGRKPSPEINALAGLDPRITVTGTVPDVRPYLWGSSVSIVPLRIGGGTRLKVYESMAARTPVVSTSVGAEGLVYRAGENILIGDSPQEFAEKCLALLANPKFRGGISSAAWELVSSQFSWDQVARRFEEILERAPTPRSGLSRGS